MKKIIHVIVVCGVLAMCACTSQNPLRESFTAPANEYRPMPFLHVNGHLTPEGIRQQFTDARDKSGYGGITVLPVTPLPHWFDGHLCPGMTPPYMSEEYFAMYKEMLEVSKELGTQIVLYDDIDFPTGSAGGRLLAEYPQHCRKYLVKEDFDTKGGQTITKEYRLKETQSWLALTALNTQTKETVDLESSRNGNRLEWQAPQGDWKIMAFLIEYNVGPPHGHLVDYMDPEAVKILMDMTYAQYDKRFSEYFGNVITKTFFDDIGFIHMEQTWNKKISDLFREKTGKNPALYYPALFEDIGPETEAARVAFHDARAELMAEGYIRSIAEWNAQRGLKSMGHPPGNYGQNTVVACGDLIKFYRHTQIPLLDVIFYYGHGRDGYKQITSAADIGDKGLVGAEVNGAFTEDMDSLDLYRVAMECLVRGVNFLVPHGLWYDSAPENIRIPPLISWDNPYWGSAVHNYSNFTARSCALLQEGRRVVDVGLFWPINALQAESWMFRDAQSGLFVGEWLPENINNYELSRLLTDELRRDFTYVHPEDLASGKVSPEGSELVLKNRVNRQNYKVLILPGGDVISVPALQAIQKYYEGGGKVIATIDLPSRSAEFGRDEEVRQIISGIFGNDPHGGKSVRNDNGGAFVFLPEANRQLLQATLQDMGLTADVAFDTKKIPAHDIGCINYTHKQKEGQDIYYFINTTDKPLSTEITLRGKLKNAEVWNPHHATMEKVEVEYTKAPDGTDLTRLTLSLDAVDSAFIVGKAG